MTVSVAENTKKISGALTWIIIAGYLQGFEFARSCLLVSYEQAPGSYGKGIKDIYFVCFWVIVITFARNTLMNHVCHPLAQRGGMHSFAKRQKLAEQTSMCVYYSIFWVVGMYLMYHSPHWMNTSQYWIDYPHTLISRGMKTYYLIQVSFYIQQTYAINVESRRKDHYAMIIHHLITGTLLVASYYSNFTRIGNAVLCCMDLADVLLPLAKILKYTHRNILCDITFGLFAIVWPVTRHGFFTIIVWATAVEPPQYIDMKWEPEKEKYFTPLTQKIYLSLFMSLNIIMLYWFAMILKVIFGVLSGKNAEDVRSDDEDNGETDHQRQTKKKKN
ncbi:TLC domain-containing protein [Phycomyces blakesleeanus]